MNSVLVVGDSLSLQRTLRRLFEADGLEVRIAPDGVAGLENFRKQTPSIVVLDLKLPRLPGKELCRAIKADVPSIPVIVLSAKGEVEEKVLLLELGADDYVTKPFSPRELLARVRRAMRRAGPEPQHVTKFAAKTEDHEMLALGDAQIDFTSMAARRAGKPVTLTALEFKLLNFLARSPDRAISREELLNEVWGYENYPTTRTVDNYVLRLRQKLEPDPANPRYFLTIFGAGYKLRLASVPLEEMTLMVPRAKDRESQFL
jgi:DNA-binding response OmpR family regulator